MNSNLVAMILAGGKGTRLEALTEKIAKPAVSFGGKYRIIDFPLSNCANSKITNVGVLTQYESVILNEYIGNGEKWGLNGVRSITSVLAPRQTEKGLSWYKGTADAIFANLDFLDSCDADYVLILSGDHIYSTTYDEMFMQHIKNDADVTISVYEVPLVEASRFGILVTDKNDRIVEFQEKPKEPKSTLASMGIYIFKYSVLKEALIKDAKNENSSHDFGKDIIPTMLKNKQRLFAYRYEGYWKDVGTISSLHEANMDLLLSSKNTNLEQIFNGNKIYSEDKSGHPQYIGKNAKVHDCLINQGAVILGDISKCVVSNEVLVEEGATVSNSVLMTGCKIGKNANVLNAVIAPNAVVKAGVKIEGSKDKIALYAGKEENHD